MECNLYCISDRVKSLEAQVDMLTKQLEETTCKLQAEKTQGRFSFSQIRDKPDKVCHAITYISYFINENSTFYHCKMFIIVKCLH